MRPGTIGACTRLCVLLALCAGVIAGCATSPKASLQDKPGLKTSGVSRVVFLTLNGNQWNDPGGVKARIHRGKGPHLRKSTEKEMDIPLKISVGEVKDSRGQTVGDFVIPVYSGDLLVDALQEKLMAAGYSVRLGLQLPRNAGRGIGLSLISDDMDQTSGLLTLKGSCRLRMKADTWHNGVKIATHVYESKVSDYALMDQDQLLVKLMKKASENIMAQSVPEIIKDLSAHPE